MPNCRAERNGLRRTCITAVLVLAVFLLSHVFLPEWLDGVVWLCGLLTLTINRWHASYLTPQTTSPATFTKGPAP